MGTAGIPNGKFQHSLIAFSTVSAFLFFNSFPCINLVNASIHHSTYLSPNCFKSSVTISLNELALGKAIFSFTIDLPNFWHILQSLTTCFINLTVLGPIKLIKQVVRDCKICQKFGRSMVKPKIALPNLSSFNEVVTLDLKQFGDKYVLY